MKLRSAVVFALIGLGAAAGVLADGEHKSMYGGVVAVVKDVQYELVAKPESLTVYVVDHGKKVSTQGATGTLTLLAGSDKTEGVLVPAGENALAASGTFKLPSGAKAVATINWPGKPAASARFEIK